MLAAFDLELVMRRSSAVLAALAVLLGVVISRPCAL